MSIEIISTLTKREIKQQQNNIRVRYLNQLTRAKRCLWVFIREQRLYAPGVKFRTYIYAYARHIGKPITNGGKKAHWDWLVNLYNSGEDLLIRRSINANFYQTLEWKDLRKVVFKQYGKKCMKCGSEHKPCIDHIKPISLYPKLALEFENMQVLCHSCNSAKSNRNDKDYRAFMAA